MLQNFRLALSLVENRGSTTVFTAAFAVVQDTYDCYNVFEFIVIVDKSFRTN
jgi:hypothetical protein